MAADFRIELGDVLTVKRCADCGAPYTGGRGFVYRGPDAFATYWVNLYAEHPDRRALFLITLDADRGAPSWEPGISVLVESWPTADDISSGIVEPSLSPWILEVGAGDVLGREDALVHARLPAIWDVLDYIVRADPAVRRHLLEA
jgi:hypothetical protein